MSKLTRRNFIKLLGKGGIIAGFAATIGLPELPKTPKPKAVFGLSPVQRAYTSFSKFLEAVKEANDSFDKLGESAQSASDALGGFVVPDDVARQLIEAKPGIHFVGKSVEVPLNQPSLDDVITSRGFVVVEEHYEIEGGEQIRVIDKMVPA